MRAADALLDLSDLGLSRASSTTPSAPVVAAFAAAEAARRSLPRVAWATVLAFALILAAPVIAPPIGAVSPASFALLVAATWAAFVVAAFSHRWLGPEHRLTRAAALADDVAWRLGALALVYLSEVTASPAFALALATGVTFSPRTAQAYRRMTAVLITGHVALAIATMLRGQLADAVFALVVVLACVVLWLALMQSLMNHGLRVRVERDVLRAELDAALRERDRDRLARELHDSVGADLTALLLRLRRQDERAAARAQRVLETMREVVRGLRARA